MIRIPVGLPILIACIFAAGCGRDEDEKKRSTTPQPSRISHTRDGDTLVRMSAETQERVGLKTQALTPQTMRPQLVAYGRLEEDPSQTFVLRAPISGTLATAKGQLWPSIGQRLSQGLVIGAIAPRFTPSERLGVSTQFSSARSEWSAATAAAAAARAEYERLRVLNSENKNISDRAVEEAASRLKTEEARLSAATDLVHLLESTLNATGPAGMRTLTVERAGDVVEVTAQPGESIEPGSPILRTTRLDRLLARVDIPIGQQVPAEAATARIVAAGFEGRSIRASRAAVTSTVDPKAQGQSFLFRLESTMFGLRPGVSLTAYVDLPGSASPGVIIPRNALVRVGGKAYVYVQTEPDQFVRKEVLLDRPTDGGYFVSSGGFSAGDRIVVVGAQTILSEEFKSQNATEEDRS